MEEGASFEFNYDFLRGVLINERQNSGRLGDLDESFYSKCSEFLNLQENALKNDFTLDGAKVLENSKRLVQELRDARMRKILLKALRDFEANSINSSGLASEEKEFYRSIVSLVSGYKGAKTVEKKEAQGVSLRILADLPKMEMPGGIEAGPFSAGDVVRVDAQAADFLLERKAALKA